MIFFEENNQWEKDSITTSHTLLHKEVSFPTREVGLRNSGGLLEDFGA